MSDHHGETRRPLDRAYLKRSRFAGYSRSVGSAVLFAVCVIIAAKVNALWQIPPAVLLMGCAQHRIFFPIHDCIHHSLFPAKAENVIFGKVLSPMIGTTFEAIRKQHMAHHRDFGSLEDPGADDYYVRFASRREFLVFLLSPLVGGVLFAKWRSYVSRPATAHSGSSAHDEEEWIFSARPYLAILVVQLLICAVITNGFALADLWRYPVLYVLPLVTVFLFLNRLRMFAEHGSLNYDVCDYLTGKRPTARSIHASRLERLFLCDGDFNYHHEHHKHPMVASWHLPKLHAENAGSIDVEDVRMSYFEALRELWHNLPAVIIQES